MHTFTTQRFYKATPDAVFAAMADPERLARWWGPQGFSNAFEVFEFQPGGRWIFTMVGPDGTRYPNECVFRQIETGHRVVIAHVVQPLFELTLNLEAMAGGTRLVWTQVLEDEAVAQAMAHIIEPANEQNLDRLGRELGFKPGPDARGK